MVRDLSPRPSVRAGTLEKAHGRVTPRAIILALLLTVANYYWIVQLEVVRYSIPTYAALGIPTYDFWPGKYN